MKKLMALLGLIPALVQAEVLVQGKLVPSASSVRARGTVWVDRNSTKDTLHFGPDYSMTSGVVLELTVCGELDPGLSVCLSQGEVRKLRGEYQMPLRQRFYRYERARIDDLDLVQEHAAVEF